MLIQLKQTLDSKFQKDRYKKFSLQPKMTVSADYDSDINRLRLRNVLVGNTLYQATLNWYWGFEYMGRLENPNYLCLDSLNFVSNIYTPAASFNSDSQLLTIPQVSYLGQNYSAILKQATMPTFSGHRDECFQVQTLTPK
jgi:hypothetical protein